MENNVAAVFCDESCHLEHDKLPKMALGAVWFDGEDIRVVYQAIREIKLRHQLHVRHELKWNKISNSKLEFYKEIINYFFDNKDLHSRILLVDDKSKLTHDDFNQTHDEWYYKMYYYLLNNIVQNKQPLAVYVDPKDTRHKLKIRKLHEALKNKYGVQSISKIRVMRSFESEVLQIADILAGAVCYSTRELSSSAAKVEIVELIKKRSGSEFKVSTNFGHTKFNLFIWSPS